MAPNVRVSGVHGQVPASSVRSSAANLASNTKRSMTTVHIAFLNRYPTLYGYAVVAPHRHVEDVVGDLTPDEYLNCRPLYTRWPGPSTR